MGKIFGANTKISGKVGQLLYRQTRTGTVISELPVKPAIPRRSARQMDRRTQWGNLAAIYKQFDSMLRRGYENLPPQMSVFNAFIQANIDVVKVYITKTIRLKGGAILAPYQITRGSLPSISMAKNASNILVSSIRLGSLVIDANTTVGLSGAGKSTIVNLLDKFYASDSGTITLDGVPLGEWDTQALRENIGLVLQKNHIFSGTIEENIRYGRPDASQEEVYEAARKAYIYDQVMALPEGFQGNALNLSGGQQQRIAIARMFLKNPPIIFLDEPTASLDAIATEQIKNSIDAIKQGRTVIVISHNIGQIIDSDELYVLDHGHAVQHGTPQEVYRQGGLYKEIFDASARSMNVDKIAETTM